MKLYSKLGYDRFLQQIHFSLRHPFIRFYTVWATNSVVKYDKNKLISYEYIRFCGNGDERSNSMRENVFKKK